MGIEVMGSTTELQLLLVFLFYTCTRKYFVQPLEDLKDWFGDSLGSNCKLELCAHKEGGTQLRFVV